jgi:hypothetical protein
MSTHNSETRSLAGIEVVHDPEAPGPADAAAAATALGRFVAEVMLELAEAAGSPAA